VSASRFAGLPDDALIRELHVGLGQAPEGELLAAADTLAAVLPVQGCAQPALDTLLHGARASALAFPDGYTPSAKYTLWQCGANARHNRWVEAAITKQIRLDAARLARSQKLPHYTGPVTILAVQHPGKGKRAHDAENIAPLVKAAIDGLRDAGVLVNDSPKWVTKVSHTTGPRTPRGRLVLHITPVDGAP